MGKKNFYAAVIDDYQYSEVTEKRYKNFVDFAIEQWGEEEMENQLRNYIEGSSETEVDWQEFFEEYYGYSTYYFALDENGYTVSYLANQVIISWDEALPVQPLDRFLLA